MLLPRSRGIYIYVYVYIYVGLGILSELPVQSGGAEDTRGEKRRGEVSLAGHDMAAAKE